MASRIFTLKKVVGNVNCAFSRRQFCSRSPVELLNAHAEYLRFFLSPMVVSVATFFNSTAEDGKVHVSCRGGTGVFVGPKLIVTSAHVVGHVSTSAQSTTVGKTEPIELSSILHRAYVGSTAVLTAYGKTLKTTPLAVSFVNDVAVLEVVTPEPSERPHCALAKSLPEEETTLLALFREQDSECQCDFMLGNVRALGQKTIKAKAPWPMDDQLGWIEHGWFCLGRGDPPPALSNSREKVTGKITRTSGSPWFNLKGEVVGIASWDVRDELAKFSVGFAVPSRCIKSVLDYAKTKRAEDPIIMDSWMVAHYVYKD